MANQANIKAVITAEDRASAALSGFGDKVAGVGSKIASAMKVAAVAAGAAAAALITFSLNQFRDIQKNVAGVQALTKNTNEARKALKNAIDFVQGKPFDRLDTIGATKQLLAFGRTTNQIKNDLKVLGNTVLISGIQWQDVTRVYGRVVASGKLLREDFNILNDAGVGLAKTLQQELGTNMQGVFDKMEDGEISAEIFQKALKKAAPDSATKKALNTFDNKLLSLKAKFRDIGFAILGVDFNQLSESGEPLVKEGGLLDRLTDGMDALTGAMKNIDFARINVQLGQWGNNIRKTGRKVGEYLGPKLEALGTTIKNSIPIYKDFFQNVINPLARSLGTVLVFAIGLVIDGFNLFLNVLKPVIGFISSVVESIGVGIDKMSNAVGPALDWVSESFNNVKDVIVDISKNVLKWIKDRFDDLKNAISDVNDFLKKHQDAIKQTATVLGVVFGPALIKASVQALIAGSQIAASGLIAAGGWIAGAISSGSSWAIMFIVTKAKAIADALIIAAQGAVAGAGWVKNAIKAGIAWTIQLALTSAKAVAAAIILSAQAAISGYAWLLNGIKAGYTWIAQFVIMIAKAIATAGVMVVQAAISGSAWVTAGRTAQIGMIGSLGKIATKGRAVSALLSTPIPMVILVAGAIIALKKVLELAKEVLRTFDVINGYRQSVEQAGISNDFVLRKYRKLLSGARRRGDKKAEARILKSMNAAFANNNVSGGFASGGFTGRGNPNDVAGVVHKGEYVVPKQHVDQSRGVPKMGGGQLNITIQAGAFMGSQQDARKYAEMIFRAYADLVKANPSKAVI